MKYVKFIYIIFSAMFFSIAASAQDNIEESESELSDSIEVNKDLIKENNSELLLYIDSGVKKTVNDLFRPSMFGKLMMTYTSGENTAFEKIRRVCTETLDSNINLENISNIVSTNIAAFDDVILKCPAYGYVADGLAKHTASLKNPISSNPAINNSLNVTSKRVIEMRDVFLKYIIGFIVFGIIFHFAFRFIMGSKKKGNIKNKSNGKSMYMFIEIAIYLILITILTLLIKNESSSARNSIEDFLSETCSGTIMYTHQGATDSSFYENADTTDVAEEPANDDTGSAAVNSKYNEFIIPLYGYSIKYPKTLTEVEEAGNSAGCIMHDKDNSVTVTTYAQWNVLEQTIDDLYKQKYYDGAKVTYKRLFKNKNYYVKSGYSEDGRLYYLKECLTKREGSEVTIFAMIEYPENRKKEFNAVIDDIFSEFPKEIQMYTGEPME